MQTPHTPGPWQALSFGSMIIGADHFVIARTGKPANKCNDQQAANARLIASAPELLATLEAIVESAEFSACTDQNNPALWKLCTNARAAIARATGAA